jgi:hypothetical protein
LLGQIDKLKYSDHDVADTDKFLEFAKRVYLETVGINPIGEPIDQPLQWETGLEKTRILGLLDLPHFGRGQYTSRVHQTVVSSHTWQGHMVGQAHLDRRRAYCKHNRVSIPGHGSHSFWMTKPRRKH